MRDGNIMLHLCEDVCFKIFRGTPTKYLRGAQTSQSGKSSADAKAPTKQEDLDLEKTGVMTDPSQSCSTCKQVIKESVRGKYTKKVGTIDINFCSTNCFSGVTGKKCAMCKMGITRTSYYVLKDTSEGPKGKVFCSKACQKMHNEGTAKSDDDVEIVASTVVAPPPPRAQSKGAKTNSPTPTGNKCAVCNKINQTKHEVMINRKKTVLCSDRCFAAFRYANKLTLNPCDNCGAYCNEAPTSASLSIKFEGKTKQFCSSNCVTVFKNKKRRVVACAWCGAKKSNFDMVERVDQNNKFQLFCTLNCLSLYRVNLQATSNQNVQCDQCHKMAPAQYHLTMSDASVRNFCSYSCVVSFQSQFAQPKQNVASQQQGTPQSSAAGKGSGVRTSARGKL